MAFSHHLSLSSTLFTTSTPYFKVPHKITFTTPKHLTVNALPSYSHSEEAILEAVSNSLGNSLPCVRSYENDMARLSLNGSVAFEQALTAAASDGGDAANEHIDAGLSTMVVDTVYPGPDDEHSTISTRLFLPAKKVKEKARKLRISLPDDILSSTTSTNMLAMTFRQVVVQELWNFELAIFVPGSRRNMEDLGKLREVTSSFALSSSDENVISGLAEAVCILALESTHKDFFQGSAWKASGGLFNWFSKSKKIASKDFSVIIHRFEDEIVENAKTLFDKFSMVRAKYKMTIEKPSKSTWTSSMLSKMEKIGGSEFSMWISEYVPAYRLQIDADRLTGLKFDGWKRSTGNFWEVFLTHSQMVGLVNILDIYFEDVYTLPSKQQLTCDVVRCPKELTKSKLDAFCSTLVTKIRDCYGWNGDVNFEPSIGAWIGEFPVYLKHGDEAVSNGPDVSNSDVFVKTEKEFECSVPEIASYQVVMSAEGNIVGFQPTSLVAVNHWSANPIAKELYGGKELSPGLLEPGLKINKPEKVVVLELLMSLNQNNPFALAREMQ
ncbi:unnamed protein product [Amaranthus hypochondriacus]